MLRNFSRQRAVKFIWAFGLILALCASAASGELKPLVIFNHDAGAGALTEFEPPITQGQVCRQLDELEGTSVGAFLFCCNIGGDVFLYPTKIGETCGDFKIADWDSVHAKYRRQIRRASRNLDDLAKAGLDPIIITQRRARQLGIQFWITFRMNDIHEDSIRFAALRSQFKLANRHLLLGTDFQNSMTGYDPEFSFAWDYGNPETRRRILAVLAEMLENYDLDGLELDFMRHPVFFKRDKVAEGKAAMTDFLRDVRAEINRVGKEKKRKVAFAVRVFPTLERCEKTGLDVRTWIKEGLVDLVTPMDPGYLDMQPNLREFVAAAKGTKVKIAGGLENYTEGYGHPSKAQALAAASAFLEQGAGAIYFFNYDCHRQQGRTNPYASEEVEILAAIGQPEKYARADKHYFVTRDTSKKTPEAGGSGQLPAELAPGKPRQFIFTVGDDLPSARRDGVLQSSCLLVTLGGLDAKQAAVGLRLNGKSPDAEHLQCEGQTLRWTDPPAQKGDNELSITIPEDPNGEKPIFAEKIELTIQYR